MPAISGGIFDGVKKLEEIEALEAQMAEPTFWDDQQAAQKVIAEANRLKAAVNPCRAFNAEVDDLQAMLELVDEMGGDPDAAAYEQEVLDAVHALLPKLDALELASFLTGPHDSCNALLTIHAGAGGLSHAIGRICSYACILAGASVPALPWIFRISCRVKRRASVQRPFELRGPMPTVTPRPSGGGAPPGADQSI